MIRFRSLVPILVTLPLAAAVAGGWAVLTVQELPEYLVAGTPATVQFAVRQHGQNLLKDLRASVEARRGSSLVTAPAPASGPAGHYAAALTLPEPGDWTITLRTNFGQSDLTLLPVNVIAADARAPAAMSGIEFGKRLFVAKGCVTCHVQSRIGPNLAGRTFDQKYLRAFLANPAMRGTNLDVPMPNLGLSGTEIAALSDYLTAAPPVQALR